MLKKGSFKWTAAQDLAFAQVKTTLTYAAVLALPDFNIPFVLETDASGKGIGVVLMQNGKALAYYSAALCPKLQPCLHMKKRQLFAQRSSYCGST